jgi:hypothetical protein
LEITTDYSAVRVLYKYQIQYITGERAVNGLKGHFGVLKDCTFGRRERGGWVRAQQLIIFRREE